MSATLELERESSTYSLKPGPAPRPSTGSGQAPAFKASPRRATHPAIPADYVPNICACCGVGMFTPRNAEGRICNRCASVQAESSCHQIACLIRDLIAGRLEFAALSAEDRKRALSEIAEELKVQVVERIAPTAFERQEIEDRDDTEMRIAIMEAEDREAYEENPDQFEQF